MAKMSLSAFLERMYEYDTVRAVKDCLRPVKHFLFGKGDIYRWLSHIAKADGRDNIEIIFDIGAAVGDKTLLFLRQFPRAGVYCFEPQQQSFRRLLKRTGKYRNRIHPFQMGFFNTDGILPLRLTSYRDCSSILPLQGIENRQVSEIGTEQIRVQRLDDFVRQQGISKIDIVKIDVEGVEKEIIEGATDTLGNMVNNLIIEISPTRKGKRSADHICVFQYLYDAGFTFVGCDGDYFFTRDIAVLENLFVA